MAKDGTARGSARPGTGPKRKALTDKINDGATAMVIDLPEPSSFEGADMPPIKEYLRAKQKTDETSVRQRFMKKPGDGLRNVAVTGW